MLKSIKSRWKLFLWRRKPYWERVAIVDHEDRVLNSPENRAREWDKLCDQSDNTTVGESIRVSFLMSEAGYKAYLATRGWTGDELSRDVFGPTKRRPIPTWYAVGRCGGLRDDEIAEHAQWNLENPLC